jgi:hypothetical protein
VAAYSINEHALILTDDRIWQRCVVKNRLPGTGSYEVAILQEPGSELRVQANEKAMSKLQIWVCASCGNWIDPDKLHDPAPVEPIWSKRHSRLFTARARRPRDIWRTVSASNGRPPRCDCTLPGTRAF